MYILNCCRLCIDVNSNVCFNTVVVLPTNNEKPIDNSITKVLTNIDLHVYAENLSIDLLYCIHYTCIFHTRIRLLCH